MKKRFRDSARRRIPADDSFQIHANGLLNLFGLVECFAHELANRHRGEVWGRELAGEMKGEASSSRRWLQNRQVEVTGENRFRFRLLAAFVTEFVQIVVEPISIVRPRAGAVKDSVNQGIFAIRLTTCSIAFQKAATI